MNKFDEAWIEWDHSNENGPVAEHIWCEVLQLDSEIDQGFVSSFTWTDLGDWGGNIIAYRIPRLADERPLFKSIYRGVE